MPKEESQSKELAYKILHALAKKHKGKEAFLYTERLPKGERLLFTYGLRTDESMAMTCYSEGFFDNPTADSVRWLATMINTKLTQAYDWNLKAKRK